MATLTVMKFENPNGAESALERINDMQKQALIKVVDAATVSWPEGAKKPKTKQAVNVTCIGALDGTFWGMLFGILFFMPFIGALVGAAFGAMAGALADFGIDDNFIANVKSKVTEGTSALFLLSSDVVVDRVTEGIADLAPDVIATNLSSDQEEKLKAAFEHAEA